MEPFSWVFFLKLLKDNWKLVAVVLAVMGLLGYIQFLRVEANHYEAKYQSVKLEYDNYRKSQEKLEAKLVLENQQITNSLAVRSAEYNELLKKFNKTVQEKIKNDKELASIRVSYNAIRLLNESASDPQGQGVTAAKPANDGEAGGAKAYSSPLTVVWATVAENNTNHLRCVEQVLEWQDFWGRYTEAVRQVNVPPR